jgi:hypothetical protein
MNVYARLGSAFQQVGGDCPPGWIVMTSQRPDGEFVASEDGEWVKAPLPVPKLVSRFQGREAMWQTPHGETTLFEAAETAIRLPDTLPTYKRAWAELQEFRRDSEMLLAIAALLGLTPENLDALFILAASIKA